MVEVLVTKERPRRTTTRALRPPAVIRYTTARARLTATRLVLKSHPQIPSVNSFSWHRCLRILRIPISITTGIMFAIRLRPGLPLTALRLQPLQCPMRAISKSSFPPKLSKLETQDDMNQARTWIKDFESQEITRDLVELSFARSSGPGGQVVVVHVQLWLLAHDNCRM